MPTTAKHRIVEAATTAGLAITTNPPYDHGRNTIAFSVPGAPQRAQMSVDFDSLGRSIGARCYSGPGLPRHLPAADCEHRVLAWITAHTVDVFDELDHQYAGEDDFARGLIGDARETGDSTPRFPEGTPEYDRYQRELTEELGKFSRQESPYGPVTNVASGNAVVGSMVGHVVNGRRVRRDDILAGQRETITNTEAMRRANAHVVSGRDVTVDRIKSMPITFEVGVDGQHIYTFLGAEAEALRDRLVELLGPSDH